MNGYIIASTMIAIIMASVVMLIRVRAARKPASVKKIILPPVFMSTGFLMFLVPQTRLPWSEVAEALVVGVIFSLLLIRTSSFEKREDEIYLKRSKAFFIILVALLLIRTASKMYLGGKISVEQTSGIFFILAFGMIVPWRIAMYFKYKKLKMAMDGIEG